MCSKGKSSYTYFLSALCFRLLVNVFVLKRQNVSVAWLKFSWLCLLKFVFCFFVLKKINKQMNR
jgi:hypothetical protein